MKFPHEGVGLLFQYPEYGKRWIGSVVSGLGNQVGWMGLVWLAMDLSGSAASIGIVTLLYQLPQALLAPVAGALLDRYPRARAMALANLALAAVFTLIPVLAHAFGRPALWAIFGLTAFAGAILPIDTTGAGPLVAELVPRDRRSQANFLNQTALAVVYLAGPALGGVWVAGFGPIAPLYFDAATFLCLALLMWSIAPARPQPVAGRQGFWIDLTAGTSYLLRHRPLLAMSILSLLFNLFYGPYMVLIPALAQSHLGGPAAQGLVWMAFSLGALAGGMVCSSRRWPFRPSASLAAIIVLWGIVTFALAGVCTRVGPTCFVMFLGGLVFSPWGALVTTIRQHLVPPALHGRVFGTSALLTAAGTPIGAWLTGLLLPALSPSRILALAGAFTIGVGLAGGWWPAIRQLDAKEAEGRSAGIPV
ncbi:MFS transporter [Alicyclobacillus macrosporangiidus]|uniref:MFS transporter n=1 Tax=Alicyclobacillus macrosporangiidus TaxID=392015 RepID=UPI000497EB78|nr:MFS transporter [Alicyclobacillus macrosporangiidus]